MNDTKNIFGVRLLEIREERGESQQELADNIGITQRSLSRYELGKRTANIELLKKVAEHYGVSADYLLDVDVSSRPACNYAVSSKDLNEIIENLHEVAEKLQANVRGISLLSVLCKLEEERRGKGGEKN